MNNNLTKIQNIQNNEGSSRTVEISFGRKVVLKNTLRPETPQETQAVMEEQKGFAARTFGSFSGVFGASKVDQFKQILDRRQDI
jgi:hypothetical protein